MIRTKKVSTWPGFVRQENELMQPARKVRAHKQPTSAAVSAIENDLER
jgi:hypothetical protein